MTEQIEKARKVAEGLSAEELDCLRAHHTRSPDIGSKLVELGLWEFCSAMRGSIVLNPKGCVIAPQCFNHVTPGGAYMCETELGREVAAMIAASDGREG